MRTILLTLPVFWDMKQVSNAQSRSLPQNSLNTAINFEYSFPEAILTWSPFLPGKVFHKLGRHMQSMYRGNTETYFEIHSFIYCSFSLHLSICPCVCYLSIIYHYLYLYLYLSIYPYHYHLVSAFISYLFLSLSLSSIICYLI